MKVEIHDAMYNGQQPCVHIKYEKCDLNGNLLYLNSYENNVKYVSD